MILELENLDADQNIITEKLMVVKTKVQTDKGKLMIHCYKCLRNYGHPPPQM